MATIHETAIIGKNVLLGEDVTIGPYTIIRDNVKIGDRTRIDAQALIGDLVTIGKDCRVFHSAVIGEDNQDLKYNGEKTETIIGDRTTIREFCTIHRGTDDKWKTVVGADCLLMAYAHVAHDVVVGDKVILANNATLAGHVEVGEYAIIGGLTAVHQFCKIGKHTMIGGCYRVIKDVPPYVIAAGEPMRYAGLNVIGLRRRKFSKEAIKELKQSYKLLLKSDLNVSDAVKKIQETDHGQEVQNVLDFIEKSDRGIIR